jgi:hypothetical protein
MIALWAFAFLVGTFVGSKYPLSAIDTLKPYQDLTSHCSFIGCDARFVNRLMVAFLMTIYNLRNRYEPRNRNRFT